MSALGTKQLSFAAVQGAGIETQEAFVGRNTVLLTTRIADIASGTGDAAKSLSSRAWKASKNRVEIQNLCRLRSYRAA